MRTIGSRKIKNAINCIVLDMVNDLKGSERNDSIAERQKQLELFF